MCVESRANFGTMDLFSYPDSQCEGGHEAKTRQPICAWGVIGTDCGAIPVAARVAVNHCAGTRNHPVKTGFGETKAFVPPINRGKKIIL